MKKENILLLGLMLTCILAGCGRFTNQESSEEGIVDASVVDTTYKVYYLNEDGTSMEGVSAIYAAETPEELMDECIDSLMTEPEEEGLMVTIPEDVQVLDTTYDSVSKQVDVYFDSSYKDLDPNQEILVRAAVVLTLTQFDGVIDYVEFYVDGEPLTENDGSTMVMMQSDFVDSTMTDIEGLSEETITLYFASSDGSGLVEEEVYVHYLSSYSLEKVVVESLISGPISENLNATMSSDVKLYDDINVSDGICYVNFNQRFLDRVNDQSFALNVYSVVNSLTELDGIESVQILIDGQIVEGNDETISLAEPLTRNEDLILDQTDTPPVVESSESEEESAEVESEQELDAEAGEAD